MLVSPFHCYVYCCFTFYNLLLVVNFLLWYTLRLWIQIRIQSKHSIRKFEYKYNHRVITYTVNDLISASILISAPSIENQRLHRPKTKNCIIEGTKKSQKFNKRRGAYLVIYGIWYIIKQAATVISNFYMYLIKKQIIHQHVVSK